MAKNKFTSKKRTQSNKLKKHQNKRNKSIKNRNRTHSSKGGFFTTLNRGLSNTQSFLQRQQSNIPSGEQPPHIQLFGHMANALGQIQQQTNNPEFQARVGQYGNQLNQNLETAKQSAQYIYQGAQNGQFGQDVQQHANTFNNGLQKAQGIFNDKKFQQNLGAAGSNASGIAKSLGTMTGHAGEAFNLASQGKLGYFQGAKLMAKHSYNMSKLGWNATKLGLNLGRTGVSAMNQMRNSQQQPQ